MVVDLNRRQALVLGSASFFSGLLMGGSASAERAKGVAQGGMLRASIAGLGDDAHRNGKVGGLHGG